MKLRRAKKAGRGRPAGTYQCSSPNCAWTWKHDGRGHWTGPSWPGHTGTAVRTWEELDDTYSDCAPRLTLVPETGVKP